MKNNTENEIRILTKMFKIYCRKNHCNEILCRECRELLHYSIDRVEKCRWIDDKPNCSDCSTKCFSADYSNKLKNIMKFSGPRLILIDPAACIFYIKRKLLKRRNN